MAVTAQLIRCYISSSIQSWNLQPSLFNRISILILRSTISKPLRSFLNPSPKSNVIEKLRRAFVGEDNGNGVGWGKGDSKGENEKEDDGEEEEIMKGFILSGWVVKWVITGDPVIALGVVIEERSMLMWSVLIVKSLDVMLYGMHGESHFHE